MRILLPILLGVFLTACASPSIQYLGAEGVPVDVGASRYTVFRKGDNVQVIRTNPVLLPNRNQVFAEAAIAIQRATGCAVRNNAMNGDQAVITATLAC